MKIDLKQIPLEGIVLSEEFDPSFLDLGGEVTKCSGRIRAEARITKVSRVVSVILHLNAVLNMTCSRCLDDFVIKFDRSISLNYPDDAPQRFIDLDPEIREEIILAYPIKPLCRDMCKGLCPKCGKNLNEGGCSCAITKT